MMGLFLIVCGSSININQVGMPLYKGVTLTGMKFLLGIVIGLLVEKCAELMDFLASLPLYGLLQ